MKKTYIGIDNGVSGTIGIISQIETLFIKTPTFFGQDYTKTKKNITRINTQGLFDILTPFVGDAFILMERPMVNPTRFMASASALRAHEAMLTIIELLGIPYQFIDSKEWQKELLPKGCTGDELKKASLQIGNRLFPNIDQLKHPDMDGLLIAEYGKRKNF